jgi:probable blue pigment (indigoidine) exporter
MTEKDEERRNVLLLVIVGLIWGSAYPVIEYGLQSGATPVAFAAARYALSALVIAGVAAATKVARPNLRSLGLSAVLGLPIIGIYGLFLYVGETTTSGALAAILICSAPLITALVALPILPGESLGRAGVVGLLVGFLGVVVLVFPPPGVVLAHGIWGPIEVLAAALSAAIGTVVLRRVRPGGETLWGASVQFAAATGFLLLILPVLEPHSALPLTGPSLGSLAYLVAGPSLVGYSLYFYLHHRVGPGRANVVAYVNPIAAVTIGTLVFAEPFELWEIAGFALVLLGLTILTRYGKKITAPVAQDAGEVEAGGPPAR